MSFFQLNRFPERLNYIGVLKEALKKAANVNTMIQLLGTRAVTNRADIAILLLKFQETMMEKNAELPIGPDSANFLYISFAVRKTNIYLNHH